MTSGGRRRGGDEDGYLVPVLWVFAASQVFWGLARSWQRGRQLYRNQQAALLKLEK